MKIHRIVSGLIIVSIILFLGSCNQDLPTNGGTSGEVDLQDGLIAYYPFTGNLQDLSGNGHNGISHSTSLAIDRFGNSNQALYLTGSMTSYMEIPHHNDLNLKGDFTVCFWINTPFLPTGYSVIFGKGQDITNFYGFVLDGETQNFLLANSQGNYQPCAELGSITTNTWYFIALYQSQAANKHGLYINNQFVAENPYYNFTANNIYPLIIGRHYVFADGSGGYEYPYRGNFDDLRIYNRALTIAELDALYNATE